MPGPATAQFDFDAEIRALYPRLWRFCLATTGSRVHAEDLAQSTCLRSLEKLDQLAVGTRFDSWLFRIAKNTWIDEMRSQTIKRGGGLVSVD